RPVLRYRSPFLDPPPKPRGSRPILDRSVKNCYLSTMPRPKSFDADDVLTRAVELFRARGYEATSLSDLESHLRLGRQSLYNTFGDKQALFHKALDHYQRTYGEPMVEGLNQPDAGLGAIREFFRTTVRFMTEENPRSGCLIANTITELGSDDPAALLRCIRSRDQLERSFRRALAQAKERGELPPHLDVDATATLLVIQNYGLNAMAKTGATTEELEEATEALLAGLG